MTANPFAQPPNPWRISFDNVLPSHTMLLEQCFEDMSLALSSFQVTEGKIWRTEVVCADDPGAAEITRRLAIFASLADVPPLAWRSEAVVTRDWVSEMQKDFPPISVGRFYVHGSHLPKATAPSRISIQVDAGAAFGTGEHATTQGCLMALEMLARRRRFRNMLDMGCGSAILAIAMARLWRSPVLAVDVDPVSVEVARENIRINKAKNYVTARCGDGYRTPDVARHGPYDLVAANILAQPLIDFAPKLARHLAPGGIAVLSGFLDSQENAVLRAHREQGMVSVRRIAMDPWRAWIVKKQANKDCTPQPPRCRV